MAVVTIAAASIALCLGCVTAQSVGQCTVSQTKVFGQRISDNCVKGQLELDITTFMESANNNLLQKYCQKATEMIECVKVTLRSDPVLVQCIGEDLMQTIEQSVVATSSATTYMCDGNPSPLQQFWKENGLMCIIAVMHEISGCSTNNKLISQFTNYDAWHVNGAQEFCREIDSLKFCVIEPMEKKPTVCPAKVVDILKTAMERVHRSLPCDKPPATTARSTTEASGLSVASCSFISTAIVTFVTFTHFIFQKLM